MGLSDNPLSRFIVLFSFWIKRASFTLLLYQFCSCSSTMQVFHWMVCDGNLLACTAIPFLLSPFSTALLCSFSLISSVLPVSPMYVLPQLHSTLYTTPLIFSSAGLLLTWVRMDRNDLVDLIMLYH